MLSESRSLEERSQGGLGGAWARERIPGAPTEEGEHEEPLGMGKGEELINRGASEFREERGWEEES